MYAAIPMIPVAVLIIYSGGAMAVPTVLTALVLMVLAATVM